MDDETRPLLEVSDLSVDFQGAAGWTRVLDGVSYDVRAGEVLGIVGESGCGKTVSSLAVMQLLDLQGGRIAGGDIRYDGRSLLGLGRRERDRIRGAEIAMIFQQPMRSLNPAFTVGHQIADVVRHHTGCGRRQAWDRAVEMLSLVHIPSPQERARAYPHQFSGGMCQRVMIAMALACSPKILIADEPSTALDVTVQEQILALLRELRDRLDLAIVIITHDLGVVADLADRVAVMYAGQVVEQAPVLDLFADPQHPYTAALLAAVPTEVHRSERFVSIPGRVALPGEWPAGCRFATRCPVVDGERCTDHPPPVHVDGPRSVRCVRVGEPALVKQGVVHGRR
ncbi:ABC transporter ATP-binding protein [Polymorphospora sp. NPDC051019]|uniref:ABC transporter ATP-binding protein n=1 Tax=Polymorphospora sp. NPDC051019 TaxID=3155725 RepID=UPI003424286A